MAGPVLALYGNVGPVTGSIRYDGDVRILGSVLPGYRVIATGNVFITRHVRGAKVVADGGIAVNGIVGPNVLLDAVGAVSVLQATDARIFAGLDIEVRAAAERSDLAAGRRILFSGAPGLLRGGRVLAGVGLEARRIEAGGGKPPLLRIGEEPFGEISADLEERLAAAELGAQRTVDPKSCSPEEYRAGRAAIAASKNLARSLERKLAQLARVEDRTGTPYLKVTGSERVQAELRLGGSPVECGDGPMLVTLDEGAATTRPLEEAVRAE